MGIPIMRQYTNPDFYLNNRTVFGMKWIFLVMCGGRGCGKTRSTQNYLLRRFFKKGKKCVWLRLTEPACRKLLANNGRDFFDPTIVDYWRLADHKIETRGNSIFIDSREFCRICAISTFYQDKGVAGMSGHVTKRDPENRAAKREIKNVIEKYETVCCDEFNREARAEKRTFDITYAFVNQLETICRLDTNRRVILLGNTLSEASDLLAECFRFIPDKPGIYRLHKKHAVIWSIEDSDKYKEARKNSIAGMLAPEESTFTNEISSDLELVTRKPLGPQTRVIRFAGNKYFVMCGNVVTCQKVSKTSTLPTTTMRPYISGYPYYKERANEIILQAQQRKLEFDKLITLKLFMKEIQLIKGA